MTSKKLLATFTAAILLSTSMAQTDSVKLVNPLNGHSYQRFDTDLDWISAKNTCASLGAHLATITNQVENEWVHANLTNGMGGVSLGGTDSDQEGVWKWITGEMWIYTNWERNADGTPLEPNNAGIENYLKISSTGVWNDWSGTSRPYLCEWESTQYIDVIAIPDVNGDGIMDQAVLALSSGNYYLRTIDSSTGKQLKQIALGTATTITPSALTAVDKQISVLITKSTGVSILQLRDGKTLALVKTLTLPK